MSSASLDLVATKILSIEVLSPKQMFVVHKNRTDLLFYEMADKSHDKLSTETPVANEITIECTFRAAHSPLVQWSVTRTLADGSTKVESMHSSLTIKEKLSLL